MQPKLVQYGAKTNKETNKQDWKQRENQVSFVLSQRPDMFEVFRDSL